MIVVVDASVLVAEALRKRGKYLLSHPQLTIVIAENQWDKASYEIRRRIDVITDRGAMSSDQTEALIQEFSALIDDHRIEVIPTGLFEHNRDVALRRVPRDPNDWAPVALALTLNAGILTNDNDFLGCGCPTWTVETLLAELDA
jgi:predicted nucleic acid-binding protein